jgi:hypothetical protein
VENVTKDGILICFRWYPRTCIRKSKKKLGHPGLGSRFENKDAKFEEYLTVNATLTAKGRMMRFRACFRWQSWAK